MVEEAVEQHAGEDLASSREKGDTTMIVAGMLVSFALVDVDDCGVSELFYKHKEVLRQGKALHNADCTRCNLRVEFEILFST